jgi:hypothetical protein
LDSGNTTAFTGAGEKSVYIFGLDSGNVNGSTRVDKSLIEKTDPDSIAAPG